MIILGLLYCTIRSVAVDIRVVVLYVTFCCCFRIALMYVLFLRLLYCTIRSVAVDIRVVVLYVTFCSCI